jgi:hypothetical protein
LPFRNRLIDQCPTLLLQARLILNHALYGLVHHLFAGLVDLFSRPLSNQLVRVRNIGTHLLQQPLRQGHVAALNPLSEVVSNPTPTEPPRVFDRALVEILYQRLRQHLRLRQIEVEHQHGQPSRDR